MVIREFEFSFNSISENLPNLYNKKLDLLLDEIIFNQFNDISFVSYDNNYL